MDRLVTVDGHELLLTNLEKPFWREEGYTKLDLIGYYAEVARYLLPHLRDRPQSLHRHPNGAHEPGFFQKNAAEIAPDWAQTVDIADGRSDRDIRYLLCQDTATLIFMANLGCIEINPWLSRVGSRDRPDFLVLDLDPLDRAFDDVIEVALVAKQVLDALSLPGYAKTSGASGIHIYLPLGVRYDYRQAVLAGRTLASLVHGRLPEQTSLARTPATRPGKVYLDWLQNGEGKTVAAPYSVRPRPGAPVSTPLRWEELRLGLRPEDFHLGNTRERLAQVGDLFAPVLGEGVDLTPLLASRLARR